MENHFAASIISLSHSAPLYLFYDGGFEFSTMATIDNAAAAAPSACSAPKMSFADELFEGGVLLPLKLPPRLQKPPSRASSAATSPTGAGKSRKQRGFDPFAAALEKVRTEEWSPPHQPRRRRRRARSLSPLRSSPRFGRTDGACSDAPEPRPDAAAGAQKRVSTSGVPAGSRRRAVRRFLCRAVMGRPASLPAEMGRRRCMACTRHGLMVCFGFSM